jgi:hypothetical protein
MKLRLVCVALSIFVLARPLAAQQRPLVTEDPETIPPGRVLVEGGVDYAHGLEYPVSGLEGNLWRLPTLGVSVGISSIAEIQIDGGVIDILSISKRNPAAPLASKLTVTGDSTQDAIDVTVATKIKLRPELERRPAIGFRFATKLPTASNESGLGLDTTDFYMSLLLAKTIRSVRVVGNVGVGILADPTEGARQNDVLTYGVSGARAISQQTELVGEINGRVSTRSGNPFPGTETRSILKLGGRYTNGAIRYDAGVYFGLTSIDPSVGFTVGFTYVFNAFTLP